MSTLKIKRENGKIFCPLADSWHIETPEEKVRQEYIKILVENYGYSLDQMAQEIKVNNSQRGQGKARADIVIWKSKQDKIESKAAFIVVECKAENVRIREEDYYQGYNYASWAGASFFVTTNEKETKYFNVDKDYLPKELVEVVAIPTAEEALNDKKVKDILSKTKTFTRDDFTKILRTCHNIGFAVDNTLSVHIVEKPFLRLVGQGVGQQIFVLHQNFHLLLHRLVFFCTACLRINISVVKFFYKPWHK